VSDALAVIAAACGVIMGASPVFQIRRMRARASSDDVSIGYFSVLLVGNVCWAIYGVSIANPALVLSNSVSMVIGSATIMVARRYRRRRG
jgi:MtN3 and saliva related transmembrane protein